MPSAAVPVANDFWSDFSQRFFSMSNNTNPDFFVADLLNLAAKKMQLDCAILTEFDQKQNYFLVRESCGEKNPWRMGDKFYKQNSYCSNIFQTKKPVVIDYAAVSEWRNHEVYKTHHIESFIGVPLYFRGNFYGVLSFFDFSARHVNFSTDDVLFTNTVARWTELSLEKRFLHLQEAGIKKVA